jgi:hypothetical protein
MATAQATGYSDFYKGAAKTPGSSTSSQIGSTDDEELDADTRRKLAIKRRLAKLKRS